MGAGAETRDCLIDHGAVGFGVVLLGDQSGSGRSGGARGLGTDFGDGGATGISACSPRRPRRGRIAEFSVPYTYLAPGTYTIKVRVFSGGCNEPQQRSKVRSRTVVVSPAATVGFTPVG